MVWQIAPIFDDPYKEQVLQGVNFRLFRLDLTLMVSSIGDYGLPLLEEVVEIQAIKPKHCQFRYCENESTEKPYIL